MSSNKNYKTGETILCVDKVSIGYPDEKNNGKIKLVLKDISLIEKDIIRDGIEATGQTVAFLGRSGRGKSTFFKSLTGLVKPTSGSILITDMNGGAQAVKEGGVGFVDQKYTLFRHKTINQSFYYSLRKSKKTNQEKTDTVNKYLNDWGLMEHKDKFPCELSGGQRQRSAVISQILSSKHFIVFDEPFSGLDIPAIENVKEAFKKYQSENEYDTIIFSTHDIKLAVELADSIYVIGFPEGTTEYSTILKHFDLKAMGLAWEEYGDGHRNVCQDIKDLLMKS